MSVLVNILKVSLAAIAGAVVLGLAGLAIGSFLKQIFVPHPNPHLFEGTEYIAIGALTGILTGFISGLALALRRPKKAPS